MQYEVRAMEDSDWDQVRKIYWQGIQTKQATFQTEVPTWDEWDKTHKKCCRLVAASGSIIIGWAAISATSSRQAYSGVVELSIYIEKDHQGYGIGKTILKALIQESEKNSFWTLQSIIIRKNQGSIALHEQCGFRTVGIREKIAKIDSLWHDTVLMEYRSHLIGQN